MKVAFLVGMASNVASAFGCECAPSSVNEAKEDAEVVFRGTIEPELSCLPVAVILPRLRRRLGKAMSAALSTCPDLPRDVGVHRFPAEVASSRQRPPCFCRTAASISRRQRLLHEYLQPDKPRQVKQVMLLRNCAEANLHVTPRSRRVMRDCLEGVGIVYSIQFFEKQHVVRTRMRHRFHAVAHSERTFLANRCS